jgi:hypothetical protein
MHERMRTDKSTNSTDWYAESSSAGVAFTGDHNTVHNFTTSTTSLSTALPRRRTIVSFLDTDLDAVVKSLGIRRASTGASERKHHQELRRRLISEIDHNRNILGIKERDEHA